MDRITVATVCYNAENKICDTMQSVFQQTYHDIEYIVVDGASGDNTMEIVRNCVEQHGNNSRVHPRVISEKDNGIYDAMNKAITLSTGKWLIFMNAGDTFYNADVVTNIFDHDISENVAGLYGDTERYYKDWNMVIAGRPLEEIKAGIPLPFCHQSVFVRTRILKELRFDTAYLQAADYNFFLQCFLRDYRFIHVELIVSRYLMGGISEANTVFHLKEKLQIREKAGIEHYSIMKTNYMIWKLQVRQWIKKLMFPKLLKRIRGY